MKTKALLSIVGAAQLLAVCADVVQCANGDRYNGKVLLVNETDVRVLNDIHGTLVIPREKVVSISFQTGTNAAPVVAPSRTAAAPDGEFKVDAAAVEQVQREFLGTANPEANQMFQEMVQGLASGTLNVGDIRARAKTTLDEVRELQKELGDEDTAGLLNSYVSILENFVRQTGTNAAPVTPSKPAR